MPPAHLHPSVLLALGLTAAVGCGEKETDTGPCLSIAPSDTSDTGDTAAGPCLSETGPCLDYAPEDTGDTGGPEDTGAANRAAASPPAAPDQAPLEREGVLQQVLRRGILPDDVAKLLGKQGAKS